MNSLNFCPSKFFIVLENLFLSSYSISLYRNLPEKMDSNFAAIFIKKPKKIYDQKPKVLSSNNVTLQARALHER
jgi:hypothetical protein